MISSIIKCMKYEKYKIIWVWLDPIDKTIHAYQSPHREEIEKAYANMDNIYINKKLNSVILFNYKHKHMQVSINYYLHNTFDKKDIKFIKRLIVEDNSKITDIHISDYMDSNICNNSDFNIIDYTNIYNNILTTIKFPINSSMYVKNKIANFKPIWEYTKLPLYKNNYKMAKWNILPQETIDNIERLYYNNNIIRIKIELIQKYIYFCNKMYIVKFVENSHMGFLYDNMNPNNIYNIRRRVKEETNIKYIYENIKNKNSYEGICAICIEDFKDSYIYDTILLSCNHRYHTICIQCIANQKNINKDVHVCPMCREHICWRDYPEITPYKNISVIKY